MHNTVKAVRKRLDAEEPQTGVSDLVSRRFREGGMSRAITDPLAAHFELLYLEAHLWLRLASLGEKQGLAGLAASSHRIRTVLEDLAPFLDRAEDVLGERDEITYRESSYEREVGPFSRLDSTQEFKDFLISLEFSTDATLAGAQVESDLMKVVYLEGRLRNEAVKPSDLYAMVTELGLDAERHLVPAFEEEGEFMRALSAAAKGQLGS